MINTKVLTSFLGKVCQDGVEQALLVDEGGSVLGVGMADGFDASVSNLCLQVHVDAHFVLFLIQSELTLSRIDL